MTSINAINAPNAANLIAALAVPGPKKFVWRRPCIYFLEDHLVIGDDTELDGLSAGWPGVTFVSSLTNPSRIKIKGTNTKLRGIRFIYRTRPGSVDNDDAVAIEGPGAGAYPIEGPIIQDCAFYGCADGVIDFFYPDQYPGQDRINNALVERTIIANGYTAAGHSGGNHSTALLLGPRLGRITIRDCLLANCLRRNPWVAGESALAFYNNLVSNWGNAGFQVVPSGPGAARVFHAGNWYESGLNTTPVDSPPRTRLGTLYGYTLEAGSSLFIKGNVGPQGYDALDDINFDGNEQYLVTTPDSVFADIDVEHACNPFGVRERVLESVGPRWLINGVWRRAPYDEAFLADVAAGTSVHLQNHESIPLDEHLYERDVDTSVSPPTTATGFDPDPSRINLSKIEAWQGDRIWGGIGRNGMKAP